MTEHSQLPWIADSDDRHGMEWNVHIVEAARPDNRVCFMTSGPEAETNAAFVVKACNSHDALVEALRSLDTLIDFSDDNVENVWTFEDTTAIEKAFALARSALELAATPAQSSKGE